MQVDCQWDACVSKIIQLPEQEQPKGKKKKKKSLFWHYLSHWCKHKCSIKTKKVLKKIIIISQVAESGHSKLIERVYKWGSTLNLHCYWEKTNAFPGSIQKVICVFMDGGLLFSEGLQHRNVTVRLLVMFIYGM